MVLTLDGSKGGRPRVLVVTDIKGLQAAKVLRDEIEWLGDREHLPPPWCSLQRNCYTYERTMAKFGLTKSSLGVTGHGLRAAYACNKLQDAGITPTVRGGDGQHTDQVQQQVAYKAVTEALGHGRISVVGAHAGSIIPPRAQPASKKTCSAQPTRKPGPRPFKIPKEEKHDSVIAVPSVSTMPRAMELDTTRLDFVQAHALRHLPRAPSGVPELRALGKGDGEVSFRFKGPAEKLSPTYLPELLTLWDAKFTEATLKLIAKNSKAEREAAGAAGLWKVGSDKHDLNAMHAQCTPEQARDFTEALATVVQKKKPPAKPKELASVVASLSDIDPVTGERKDKVSASVRAVATMRTREIVKSMGGAAEQGEQMFSLSCTATRFRSKGQTAGTGCRQRAARNAGDHRS